MKHTVKILSLVILGTLLLSGCNLLNKEEATSTTAEVVSADTILDQQIYQRAIDSKDAKACDTIKDEAVKNECEDVVNALVLTDEAVAELDDDFCGDIKLERYEEECENRVQLLIEQEVLAKKQAEQMQKQDEENASIAKEAYEKQDFTICDKMEDQNQKYTCRFNVLTDLAKSKQDITYCDKIEKESYIEECKSIINSSEF